MNMSDLVADDRSLIVSAAVFTHCKTSGTSVQYLLHNSGADWSFIADKCYSGFGRHTDGLKMWVVNSWLRAAAGSTSGT